MTSTRVSGCALYLVVIIGGGVLLATPIILLGFARGSDTPAHLVWARHFSTQLWHGDIYPRWLANTNGGLGSPTFFYYAPVAYYLTSLFEPAVWAGGSRWLQLELSACVALVASGLTAYLWLRPTAGREASVAAAMAYAAMPYHLGFDLYYRFAFAEFWAFVWLPLLMYAADAIARRHRAAVAVYAVTYAVLIMTHVPSALMFSPVPLGYLMSVSNGRERWRATGSAVAGSVLGAGLASVYLIPALTLQEHASLQRLTMGRFFYADNFVPPLDMSEAPLRLFIFILTLLTLGMSLCGFWMSRRAATAPALNAARRYWLTVSLLAVFMMCPLSAPVWSMVSPLQMMQFPWRMNVVLSLSTSALIALGVCAAGVRRRVLLPLAGGGLLFVSASFGVYFHGKLPVRLHETLVAQKLRHSLDVSEYTPRWALQGRDRSVEEAVVRGWPGRVRLPDGSSDVTITRWEPRRIDFEVALVNDGWVTVGQYYYPGWTARLDGQTTPLETEPSANDGLVRVWLPSGRHRVALTLSVGKEERAGQLISCLAALVVVVLVGHGCVARDRVEIGAPQVEDHQSRGRWT